MLQSSIVILSNHSSYLERYGPDLRVTFAFRLGFYLRQGGDYRNALFTMQTNDIRKKKKRDKVVVDVFVLLRSCRGCGVSILVNHS